MDVYVCGLFVCCQHVRGADFPGCHPHGLKGKQTIFVVTVPKREDTL